MREVALASVVLLASVGCGESLPTVPVTGTVKYQGKPVEAAAVVFLNTKPDSTAKSSVGTTDSQGNFSLQTSMGGGKMAKGALPGDYVITVSKAPPAQAATTEGGDAPPAGSPQLPSADKMRGSGDTQSASAFMPMSGQGPSSELPLKYSDPSQSDLKKTVAKGDKNHFDLELTD